MTAKKTLLANPLVFTGILSGVALALLLVFLPHDVKPYVTWGDIVLVFATQLIAATVVGCIGGFILRNSTAHSYFVSITAMIYTYDAAAFLAFMRGFGYVLFALWLAFASVGLFYLANKLFTRYSSRKKRLTLCATGGAVILFIICAPLGSYIMRLIASTVQHY